MLISNALLIVILLALIGPVLRDRRNGRKAADDTPAGGTAVAGGAPSSGSTLTSGTATDAATATAAPAAAAAPERRDILLTLGMFVAAMVLTWAFGVTIALALVVFVMFRVFTGMSWLRSAVSASLAIGLLIWVFNVLLDLPLVGGSILQFRYFL